MYQDINFKLQDLYQSKWDSLVRGRSGLLERKMDYTRPLLIKLKDEQAYSQADKRVMILGQETNGWAELGAGSAFTPENTMNKYVEFFGDGRSVKWRSPFWNESK